MYTKLGLKQFSFSCASIPEEEKTEFENCLENMESIEMRDFVLETENDAETLRNMILYPNDFDFFKYKDWLIFEHSAIHYIFK